MSPSTSPLNFRKFLAHFEQDDPGVVLRGKGRIAPGYDTRTRALIAKVRG